MVNEIILYYDAQSKKTSNNKSLFNNKYFNQLYSNTSILRPTQLFVFFLRTTTYFGLNRPPPYDLSKFITFWTLLWALYWWPGDGLFRSKYVAVLKQKTRSCVRWNVTIFVTDPSTAQRYDLDKIKKSLHQKTSFQLHHIIPQRRITFSEFQIIISAPSPHILVLLST